MYIATVNVEEDTDLNDEYSYVNHSQVGPVALGNSK